MRTITTFVLAAISGMLWVAPAQAQVLYGSIVGQVADAASAVAPGATVRLTHRETNQQRVATTNASGEYGFPALPGGAYDVVISKEGFPTFTAQGVTVAVGQVARVDAVLRVGAVSETVSVTGESAVLQTDRAVMP